MVERKLVWHDYPDDVPVSSTWLDRKKYLVEVAYRSGRGSFYMVLEYVGGWNCSVDSDGNVSRENEIFDIIAWAEIPPMRPKVVNK